MGQCNTVCFRTANTRPGSIAGDGAMTTTSRIVITLDSRYSDRIKCTCKIKAIADHIRSVIVVRKSACKAFTQPKLLSMVLLLLLFIAEEEEEEEKKNYKGGKEEKGKT